MGVPATLVEERRVGVVKDVFGLGTNGFQVVQEKTHLMVSDLILALIIVLIVFVEHGGLVAFDVDHHVVLEQLVFLDLAGGLLVGVQHVALVVLEALLVSQIRVDLDGLGLLLAGGLVLQGAFFQLSNGCFLPHVEEHSDIVELVIGVEQGSHRVQQILVVVQVLLPLYQVQLKLVSNVLVLESRVVLDVFNKLFQEVFGFFLLLGRGFLVCS